MMSEMNKTFCKVLLRNAKADLRAKLGTVRANKLIRENMDVHGSKGWYFLHWVKDDDVIEEDIWDEGKAGNIDEARANAITNLLEHIDKGAWKNLLSGQGRVDKINQILQDWIDDLKKEEAKKEGWSYEYTAVLKGKICLLKDIQKELIEKGLV